MQLVSFRPKAARSTAPSYWLSMTSSGRSCGLAASVFGFSVFEHYFSLLCSMCVRVRQVYSEAGRGKQDCKVFYPDLY